MPKFGLKCFLGSFIFSLAAVFAATKFYNTLSHNDKQADFVVSELETKNIELFAQNEDDLTSYEVKEEKFASNEIIKDVPIDIQNSEVVLYEPEDENATQNAPIVLADNTNILKEEKNEEIGIINKGNEDVNNELVIADVSSAPVFEIPLVYNFEKTASSVSVSSEAESSQIALASANVVIDNLGSENEKALTSIELEQPLPLVEDSPWEVAEVANKHITRNTIEQFNEANRDNISALDRTQNDVAKSENETQVVYKIKNDNILLPIPEDILNEENLTPKLATSEENKKLEKKVLEDLALSEDKDNEDKTNTVSNTTPIEPLKNEKTEKKSSSLTEGIVSWLSGGTKKTSEDNVIEENDSSDETEKKSSQSSTFRKLFGLDNAKNNIAPTELKLSFQPNRAEISGQTLEWLHAFSENVTKNENVIIEIRINGDSNKALQQKRLNLLYTILINNSVDYNKINIIFTDREPNSFIIRNVRYATEEELAKAVKKGDNPWY